MINERTPHGIDNARWIDIIIHRIDIHTHIIVMRALQFKYTFNDINLCAGGIQARKGRPIIDDQTGPQDIGATIDRPGHERNLQERWQFLNVIEGGPRMDHATLIGEFTVTSDNGLSGHRLTKDFHA